LTTVPGDTGPAFGFRYEPVTFNYTSLGCTSIRSWVSSSTGSANGEARHDRRGAWQARRGAEVRAESEWLEKLHRKCCVERGTALKGTWLGGEKSDPLSFVDFGDLAQVMMKNKLTGEWAYQESHAFRAFGMQSAKYTRWKHNRVYVDKVVPRRVSTRGYMHALTHVRVGPVRIADYQAELSVLALFFVFQLYHFSIRKDVNAHFPV
jgi:hypothetical protein